MSSSTKIDDNKKNILILGKAPAQGWEQTLSAEKMYSINFTEDNKTFYYNGACIMIEQIILYFLMVQKFINSKQKTLRFNKCIMLRKYFKTLVSR